MTYSLFQVSIVVSYGALQFFELTALLGRIAGIERNSVMLGYSIQQTVYMITRFFMLALLPLLGFIVDAGIETNDFATIAHLCLISATLLGVLAIIFIRPIIAYYAGVIFRYQEGGSFFTAFFGKPSKQATFRHAVVPPIFSNLEVRKTFFQASLVFLIYSTGIFVSFYLALMFHDFRATLSQMSGAINAFGTVLLTLVIEPRISRSIDKRDPISIDMVLALFWGRILATGITGQALLALLFFATNLG